MAKRSATVNREGAVVGLLPSPLSRMTSRAPTSAPSATLIVAFTTFCETCVTDPTVTPVPLIATESVGRNPVPAITTSATVDPCVIDAGDI